MPRKKFDALEDFRKRNFGSTPTQGGSGQKQPPRPFLTTAALEDVRSKVDKAMRDAFNKQLDNMGRPLKVHFYRNQGGASYQSMGKEHKYADTACKHNWPVANVTEDPLNVTCKRCLRAMAKDASPPEADAFECEMALEEEIAHANGLADTLRYAIKFLDQNEHAVAIIGTSITVGDVIRGRLAEHEARRNIEGYR